jgi:hypothetical protein
VEAAGSCEALITFSQAPSQKTESLIIICMVYEVEFLKKHDRSEK